MCAHAAIAVGPRGGPAIRPGRAGPVLRDHAFPDRTIDGGGCRGATRRAEGDRTCAASSVDRSAAGARRRDADRTGVPTDHNAHKISLGRTAPAYHLTVLVFAEECAVARRTGECTGPAWQFDGGAPAPER